jgi:ribosome-binding ATPase YchF (GTP1/OBG family)
VSEPQHVAGVLDCKGANTSRRRLYQDRLLLAILPRKQPRLLKDLHHGEGHQGQGRGLLERNRARRLGEALGLGEGALPRMVRSAYHLLGLRTYFTTGEKETRAWTFNAGAKAPECAGKIHSDLQRGFIRADVIAWDELLAIGSWNKAKELGKIRVEGKDYEVCDGDTLEIRHNS